MVLGGYSRTRGCDEERPDGKKEGGKGVEKCHKKRRNERRKRVNLRPRKKCDGQALGGRKKEYIYTWFGDGKGN